MHKHTNSLINETSPYLLQHAHNPVHWHPWGEEALNKAKSENKPIILSIGYSSCHWCHVMEREVFENEALAKLMNDNFISIKVDREERPDIDQIYMEAVRLLGIAGGWPLNCFLTSDAMPFLGGTYFPPGDWEHILGKVSEAYQNKREGIESAVTELKNMLNKSELERFQTNGNIFKFDQAEASSIIESMTAYFDEKNGGIGRAPKFPMPGLISWLLSYAAITKDNHVLDFTELTLDKMANGGIFDHVAGGFSRYTVDSAWVVPHFEKMLYDNAQLLSLYSKAYTLTKKKKYKDVVYKTIQFLKEEMMSDTGGFYSGIDADSEGEEGKFYCWSFEELENSIGANFPLFSAYFNITEKGNWEDGKNILHCTERIEPIAHKHFKTAENAEQIIEDELIKLKTIRNQRIRPETDYKIICSWNALLIKALTEVYVAFDDEDALTLATQTAEFICNKLLDGNKLFRTYNNGKRANTGCLDDYANTIDAFIRLYETSTNEKWLMTAKYIAEYMGEHFSDENEPFLFYSDKISTDLIVRKKELYDNVMPSSNAVAAICLKKLAILFDIPAWEQQSDSMLHGVKTALEQHPTSFFHWGTMHLSQAFGFEATAIIGTEAKRYAQKAREQSFIEMLIAPTNSTSMIPYLKDKVILNNKTTVYRCVDKTCFEPITD